MAVAGRAAGQVCVSPIECKSFDNLSDLLASTGGAGFPTCDLSDGSLGVMCSTPAEGDIANRWVRARGTQQRESSPKGLRLVAFLSAR